MCRAELRDEGAVSSAAEVKNGRNTFQVSVDLPDEPEFEKFFRAGYTGSAKLGAGYSPLINSGTRRFFNWLRTNVTL